MQPLNGDMFWHGLSLVSSRVKRDFVESFSEGHLDNLGDVTGLQLSADTFVDAMRGNVM